MSRWIIDGDGEVLHLYSPRLRSKLHVRTLLEQDHVPLLRNLGYIGLHQTAQGTSISLRPATVSPVALAALSYWIYDHAPARLLLAILEPGHCLELYSCLARALARIEALFDACQGRLFHRRGLSLDQVPAPLEDVFAAWRVAGPASDFAELQVLLQREPAGRYLLSQPDIDAGRFVIREAGVGLLIPDPAWASSQLGRSIADVPDKAYGRWASEVYQTVLARSAPQLDHIEAKIYWPRIGRLQHRYTRLILPVRDRGRPMLLTVNYSPGGVGGRLEAA